MKADIKLLEEKVEQTQNEQLQASEEENYIKADELDMRIRQTSKLVEGKEQQINQMNENYLMQEVMKADKWQELSDLMHRSISKIQSIMDKNLEEQREFKETEESSIQKKQKQIKYETIRIKEERKIQEELQGEVQEKLNLIEEKVYKDTIQQHQEKHKLDGMIEDIDKEVEELMRIIERKKKEKEMLILEKDLHEKKIDQARLKYKDKIDVNLEKLGSVTRSLAELDSDQVVLDRDRDSLKEMQSIFDSKFSTFRKENKNLNALKKYMSSTSKKIDKTNEVKKELREQQKTINAEEAKIKSEGGHLIKVKEFIVERVQKIDKEIDQFQQEVDHMQKKIEQLNKEKKQFASAKKFKDAARC